jgi:hypothetical protein
MAEPVAGAVLLEPSPQVGSDPDTHLTGLRRWYDEAVAYWAPRFDEAREDFAFYNNRQWAQEDLEDLKKQKRPALTINLIAKQVNLLTGQERGNRTEYKAVPKGALPPQALAADDMTRLIKHVYTDTSEGPYVSSEVFQDGIIGELGWWEVPIVYEENPIDGDIVVRRVKWDHILPDPRHEDYGAQDSRYLWRLTWMGLEDACHLWPTHEADFHKAILIGSTQSTGLNPERPVVVHDVHQGDRYKDVSEAAAAGRQDTILFAECWYRQFQLQTFFVDRLEGDLIRIGHDEGLTLAESLVGQDPYRYRIITHEIRDMRVSVYLPEAHVLIEDGPTPYQLADGTPDPHFPYVPYKAFWVEGESHGIVRPLKDPQREKNKRRSQALHILNTSAKSGWIMEDGALADGKGAKWMEENAARTGVVIVTASGKFDRVKPIAPSGTPVAAITMEKMAEADLPGVSGINPDALGDASGRSGTKGASGKAVALRQQQAGLISTPVFDNYHRSKRLLGQMLVRRIQQAFTVARMVSIVSSASFAAEPLAVNVPDPESRLGTLKNNVTLGRYDIVVVESSAAPTVRLSNLLALTEIQDAYKNAGVPFPLGILVEASDLAFDLKQRLMESLPPAMKGSGGAADTTPNAAVGSGAMNSAAVAASPGPSVVGAPA